MALYQVKGFQDKMNENDDVCSVKLSFMRSMAQMLNLLIKNVKVNNMLLNKTSNILTEDWYIVRKKNKFGRYGRTQYQNCSKINEKWN